MHRFVLVTAAVFLATQAASAIIVDGTADAGYGLPLSIQNTDTHFGDAVNGDPQVATAGSEIDQVFGVVDSGYLYMIITGNLESGGFPDSHFNKLEVFIDSEPGVGVNTIDGPNLPHSVDGYCCGGFLDPEGNGALQNMNALTFDADFAADYFLTFTNGNESVGGGMFEDPFEFWALTGHYADLTDGANGQVSRFGMQTIARGAHSNDDQNPDYDGTTLGIGGIIDQNNQTGCADETVTPCDPEPHEFVMPVDETNDPDNQRNHRDMDNDIGMLMAIDNSNTVGVAFRGEEPWNTTGDPQNVVTGIEFAIPLAQIGVTDPSAPIKVTAFIDGDAHSFASNQFSGTGVLAGNLADTSTVDLSARPGNQYVTINACGQAGDVDGDCDVDLDDYNAQSANMYSLGGRSQGDLNDDLLVNFEDFVEMALHFGESLPETVDPLPEPATLTLMLAFPAIMVRRRR